MTLIYHYPFVSTLVLKTFGLIMAFSTQSVIVAANDGSALINFTKYLIFVAVGTLDMVGISHVPLSWFPRMVWELLVLTIALQCPAFTPVDVDVYDSHNWTQVLGVNTA